MTNPPSGKEKKAKPKKFLLRIEPDKWDKFEEAYSQETYLNNATDRLRWLIIEWTSGRLVEKCQKEHKLGPGAASPEELIAERKKRNQEITKRGVGRIE